MPVPVPSGLSQAHAVLTEAIARGVFPGAVAAVGNREGLISLCAFGHAEVEPDRRPMRPDTIFDVASLTKVIATTTAVLQLIEQGHLTLEQPVRSILPVCADRRIRLKHLLTHTSGLPAWRPLYLEHRGWEAVTGAICRTELTREPGTDVTYSDLGFMLLGAIIMRVTGISIPDYCRKAIFAPLGMAETGWLPEAPRERFAATERGNPTEVRMCGGAATGFGRWRHHVLCGEVHDGNTYYGLDGVSSHAGLFAPAEDLARFATALMRGGGPLLSASTLELATTCHTPGMREARGLGWQKPPAASCGERLSPGAFGHTGFTGTSLWIDPGQNLFVILLTNRVHPTARDGIMSVRRAFHNAVVASLEK